MNEKTRSDPIKEFLKSATSAASLGASTLKETHDLIKSINQSYTIPSTGSLFAGLTNSHFDTSSLASAFDFGPIITDDREKILRELRHREDEVLRLYHELKEEQSTGKERKQRVLELEQKVLELDQANGLAFLFDRVHEGAQEVLYKSEDFRQLFLNNKEHDAFIMAIDIRRSTDLMLKARSPEAFARFITALCGELMEIIKGAYGVIDKFTGDGVLAFFPDFYSGPDAPYRSVDAADKCHLAFANHYLASRRSFKAVLADVGLGIGIDYGKVRLVKIAGSLTVVGEPVVYACRLSGAPAGVTYINQPAYEILSERFRDYCSISETTTEIKHEGKILVYEARKNNTAYAAAAPEWLKESKSERDT
jgi:class 3 adenylate cyclase